MTTMYLEKEDATYAFHERVDTEVIYKARWYESALVVFKHTDDKYYQMEAMIPLTEIQDGQDIFNEIPVPCTEVHQVEETKVVKVWKEV